MFQNRETRLFTKSDLLSRSYMYMPRWITCCIKNQHTHIYNCEPSSSTPSISTYLYHNHDNTESILNLHLQIHIKRYENTYTSYKLKHLKSTRNNVKKKVSRK